MSKERDMDPIEALVLATMNPASMPQRISILGKVLGKSPDARSAVLLLTSSIANLVGNIPEELWEKMVKVDPPPCKEPDCECHLVQKSLMKELIEVKKMYLKALDGDEQERAE